MKRLCHLTIVASLAGIVGVATAQTPPQVTPQVLATMRNFAVEAERNCGFFYNSARKIQIRSSHQGKALAATLRLRDTMRKFLDATRNERWPRPDWLRQCSENLLNAWIDVDQTIGMLEAPPPVLEWWNRAQQSLVTLYHAAAPYMGRPAGGPLPTALAGGPPRETRPVGPAGQTVVK